ncbi:Hypothetical predicted protein [Cloeon dipterum]|uniref:Uncharacterized protein n=1 Tax=Cloeon dipterum TaxID=197152 RepID=A0A8S1C9T9_9INSE|nr:Hypothetical predicted protein [Cloeon dipterum]
MKFLVCIALLAAVASAEPGVLGYNSYGYAAAPYGHHYATPVVKAIAPVATSYANVHSVHHAAPVAYGYGHSPLAYNSYGRVYGNAYNTYPAASAYSYGYKNYGLHGLHY